MFIWDLLFCLFKRIASNEKEKIFSLSLRFFVLFPKENKIIFEL